MRMVKRKLQSVVILMLIAALFAGCSSASKTPVASTTAKPADTVSAAPNGEVVTLKYIDWQNKVDHDTTAELLKAFEHNHPTIKVDYQSIPYDQFLTKVNAMAASKSLPDMSFMMEAQTLKWAESGVLQDLSSYFKDGSLPAKLETLKFQTPDGQTVGYSVANEVILLYYNKALFDEAGIPYPPAETEKAWTWDQMVDAARKLTKDRKGKHPNEAGFDNQNIVQFGINIPKLDFMWLPFALSNGGGEVTQDGKTLILDQPESIEAIQDVADLALVEHVSPSMSQSKSLPGDIGTTLLTKKVAMAVSGQWEFTTLAATKGKGLEYGVGVLPIYKKPVTTNTGTPLVIYKSTKHLNESLELYKFLMDPINSLALIQNGTWMPNEEKWYTDADLIKKWTDNPVHPPEYKTAVIDYALKATVPTPWYFLPTYGRISDILNPGLDAVWSGSKTAKEAITNDIMPKIKPIFDKGKANE
jgi:multiple sugar transport system substrate-binding protein